MGDPVLISAVISCVVILLSWVWGALNWLWIKPKRLERTLREQGIKGHCYRLFYGDLKEENMLLEEATSKPMNLSNDIVPRVLPFLQQTIMNYGKVSFVWVGPVPRVVITDPILIKDVLSNKFGHFEKLKSNPLARLLAIGLPNHNDEQWARHRRIINPAFHLEKLKHMLPAFYSCCNEMISRWEKLVMLKGSCELDLEPEFHNLSGDTLSRAAFGSSFEEGREIFQLQNEQKELVMQVIQSIYVPGLSLLPTKRNKRMKQIYREVEVLFMHLINKRTKAIQAGEASNTDLLGLLLESNFRETQRQGNNKNIGMSMGEVIDECKAFYFAGQETTSFLLLSTMVLLSMHPDWQMRAREEVLQVFGMNKPDYDGLAHLKIITMIFYEVLRLYPPVVQLIRYNYKEMKLGEFTLPPGVEITVPTLLVHHDRDLWGDDAQEFNPERFSEGVAKATKNEFIFFPFGWGPRLCIGQNFALIEAKVALAMILQRFSVELSPSYAHAPITVITLQSQFGAKVILTKI